MQRFLFSTLVLFAAVVAGGSSVAHAETCTTIQPPPANGFTQFTFWVTGGLSTNLYHIDYQKIVGFDQNGPIYGDATVVTLEAQFQQGSGGGMIYVGHAKAHNIASGSGTYRLRYFKGPNILLATYQITP